jgi:hypothetical protein
MPASSSTRAVVASYAVSIAQRRPSAFQRARCGTRTRVGRLAAGSLVWLIALMLADRSWRPP